jgi:2'-5' RNA ligase
VPRLFVGIDFPPDLKLGLSKPCAGVPGARWVQPSKFHLTLRFIGTVDDPTAANIAAVLLEIEALSFMLSLKAVNHFRRTYALGRRREEPDADLLATQDRGSAPADWTPS